MIVAITGATGFIGRKVAEFHLNSNDDVRYLTRTNDKPLHGAKAFLGDVNSAEEDLVPFFKNADVIYHCAGEVENEALMYRTHVEGTRNLLHIVDKVNVNTQKQCQWIQLSSCGAYGQNTTSSTVERFVNENSFENPNGEYERTKTEADQLIINFAKKHDFLKFTIIRPTIVFGPGMRSTAIIRLANLIKRRVFFYVGNKNAVANYVHVDDVVSAMTLSSKMTAAHNQTFIVSNDCKFSDFINVIANTFSIPRPRLVLNELILRKFITIVGRWVKLPISNEHIDVMMRQTYYSNDKLKKYLSWSPKASVLAQLKEHMDVKSG
jgi:nucleoside-diphosphate-sugar epimerase